MRGKKESKTTPKIFSWAIWKSCHKLRWGGLKKHRVGLRMGSEIRFGLWSWGRLSWKWQMGKWNNCRGGCKSREGKHMTQPGRRVASWRRRHLDWVFTESIRVCWSKTSQAEEITKVKPEPWKCMGWTGLLHCRQILYPLSSQGSPQKRSVLSRT